MLHYRRGGSYIDSPDWVISKKATINAKDKDDQCFQYVVMVSKNYGEIKWNQEWVSNIKPFIYKCNWKTTNYPSKIDDWKTIEKNNLTFALNILYIKEK